jgi:transglutaminase-like putative cysteine protease
MFCLKITGRGTGRFMKQILSFFFANLICIFCFSNALHAKTVVLDGRLESRIQLTQQISFSVEKEISQLNFRFALPASFSNKTVSQGLAGLGIEFDPKPEKVKDETDDYGNRYRVVIWEDLKRDARINISFEARMKSELTAMESMASFPLKDLPADVKTFLKSTEIVQSKSREISSLAKTLTDKSVSEYDAVTSILNYVSDNVKYAYNPPQYDAIYTLKTRSGNCQNFAHLSIALLRAAGIPARIVGGISLKEPWKIPVGNDNFLVQSLGQGGHAWMEIYFPDLGWLSYDPQQSKQFTSSRHIKQTHGLDSRDINDSWRASPYLPQYNENINAKFLDDSINLVSKFSASEPKSYMLSNNFIAKSEVKTEPPPADEKPFTLIAPPVVVPPVVLPPPVAVVPPPSVSVPPVAPHQPVIEDKPRPVRGKTEFGNTDFPALVDVYQIVGDQGIKIMDKETAEYVTSRYVYSQAFTVDCAMSLQGISLAMRKFGGDGTIYVDVVKDEEGKPGFSGERSLPVPISDIKYRPGYYWIDFAFARGSDPLPVLSPGKYWIILRHSGEAIVNWFYIPGNPYGDSDDTRSTLKGYKWEDLLNYDFVFRVTGMIE